VGERADHRNHGRHQAPALVQPPSHPRARQTMSYSSYSIVSEPAQWMAIRRPQIAVLLIAFVARRKRAAAGVGRGRAHRGTAAKRGSEQARSAGAWEAGGSVGPAAR
jgi:hypothetical protein